MPFALLRKPHSNITAGICVSSNTQTLSSIVFTPIVFENTEEKFLSILVAKALLSQTHSFANAVLKTKSRIIFQDFIKGKLCRLL
jgi:hypothetical protein